MINDKPIPKRHIGPAMQWAKPKSAKDTSTNRGNRAINVEFPDIADDPDPTVSDVGEAYTSDRTRGGTTSSSSDALTSYGRQSRAEPADSETTAPWWGRGTEHSEGERSAWSEYSTALTRGVEERFPSHNRGADEVVTTYNYGSYDDASSATDANHRETARHNASSFDGAQPLTSQDDRTVWWQYLLPIAVVGLVIFLALLTFIT